MQKFYIIIISLLLLAPGCSHQEEKKIFVKYVDKIGEPFHPLNVSVSSDGNYAISSHHGKFVVLWDISKKTHKIISKNGNIYSAYFIKDSHNFIWQDLDNIVHVQNTSGQEIKAFKNFPVYGQVMSSDLNTYIASDIDWNVFMGIGEKQKNIKFGYGGFIGDEKLLNLELSRDNKYLVTAGFGTEWDDYPLSRGHTTMGDNIKSSRNISLLNGVVLWDVETGKPIRKLRGPGSKLNATFSPNAKKIVAGDEGGGGYIWTLASNLKPIQLDALFSGHLTNPDAPLEEYKWDKSGVLHLPIEFAKNNGGVDIIAMKYIDNYGHFLRFPTGIPYAILYKDTKHEPLKYFKLGSTLLAAISDYDGNEGFDTAPDKNILVMSQNYSDGILVFKFDPEKQTLTRIWAPTIESDNDITDEQLQEFHNIRTIDSSRF